MAGKGGGAWKVAYADFATAMMTFFLVMWITGQSKPVKQAVAKYFEDPLGVGKGSRSTSLKGLDDSITIGPFESGRGPARGLAMANLRSNAPLNPRGVSATKPPRMILYRDIARTRSTGTIVQFPEESAELNEDGRNRLTSIVPLMLGKPNVVEIRSPLPRRPPPDGTPVEQAWQFSLARCVATMKFLEKEGIEPHRFRLTQAAEFEKYMSDGEGNGPPPDSFVEVFVIDQYVNAAKESR